MLALVWSLGRMSKTIFRHLFCVSECFQVAISVGAPIRTSVKYNNLTECFCKAIIGFFMNVRWQLACIMWLLNDNWKTTKF